MLKWDLSYECNDDSTYTNQKPWYTTPTEWRTKKNYHLYRCIKRYLTELRPHNKANKEINSKRNCLFIIKGTGHKLICWMEKTGFQIHTEHSLSELWELCFPFDPRNTFLAWTRIQTQHSKNRTLQTMGQSPSV